MGRTKEETPKSYRVRLTENATQDIDNLTGYIAYIKHQPLNAIYVGDSIFETIARIERNPWSFRECEEIPSEKRIFRKAVCLSWLIIYKILDSEIIILGLIHGSRKPTHIKQLRHIKD